MTKKTRLSFQHQAPEFWPSACLPFVSRARASSSKSSVKPTTTTTTTMGLLGRQGGAAADGSSTSAGAAAAVMRSPSSPCPLMATMGGADPSSPAPRRPSSTTTTTITATAAIGVMALAVLLVRKGRISKGRLLELAAAAVGGLLSSSCCTVQLVLNSLSLGCAGFAVLDTFRPLFLALTFSSLAYKTWRYDLRLHRSPLRSLPTWLIALALASSPAVVRAVNRRRGLAAAALASLEQGQEGPLALLPSAGKQPPPPLSSQPPQGPLVFRVTGMKCEACGNGLRNAVEAVGGLKADVLFEEGVIYVERDGKMDEDLLEAAVQTCVEEMGYVAERVLPAATTRAGPGPELVVPQ